MPLDAKIRLVDIGYPKDSSVAFSANNNVLEICFDKQYQARFFEITLENGDESAIHNQ